MKAETALVAAQIGGWTWFVSFVAELLQQIFGVPIPVFIAALAGALYSVSKPPARTYWSAFLGALVLTAFACFLSHLAAWGLEVATGVKIPTGALAGVAGLLAWGIPIAGPIVEEMLPEVVRSRMNRWKGNGGQGNGGQGGGS